MDMTGLWLSFALANTLLTGCPDICFPGFVLLLGLACAGDVFITIRTGTAQVQGLHEAHNM